MPSPIGLSTAVIAEKLDVIAAGQNEIKAAVSSLDARMDAFERSSIKATAEMQSEVVRAHGRIIEHEKTLDEHSKQIKALNDVIQPMIYTNRVLGWLAGLIGASVLALLWAILVGQVQVVFP